MPGPSFEMTAAIALPNRPRSTRRRLSATGIDKRFLANRVLRAVSLHLAPGEVHTLMGENGAGKSTLFRILAGIHRPDAGLISLDGESVVFRHPHDAQALGIYLVPQEPALMGELSVAENMYMGRPPTLGRWPKRIDWATMRARAKASLSAIGLDIDVRAPARHLSIAQQQLVECAKALLRDCRIILFDEPTSPLTTREVGVLFNILSQLRGDGYTLGFISHRMDEVITISDRITVLRDGTVTDEVDRHCVDRKRLVNAMVGRTLSFQRRQTRALTRREPVFRVEHLSHEPVFRDVTFDVRAGEVVGFAGLIGAGRTEIAETICGIRRKTSGRVLLDGRDISGQSIAVIIKAGIVYVPEDRQRHGAILPMSIGENAVSGQLDRLSSLWGVLRRRAGAKITNEVITRFRVRTIGHSQPVQELSGGNQQKVVFGKWLSTNPRVAILDEPTRGVDVGAKEEIYSLIDQLAADGMAIVVISSELEELITLCDRVLTIYEGQISAEIRGADVTAERVGAAFLGTAV